jgi:mannitol-1-phosphate 5-dehydrogenase
MTKKNLLIYGAGAIGRGYLPWVFQPDEYDYFYVESDPTLQAELQRRHHFTSFMTAGDDYVSRSVAVQACYLPGEEARALDKADLIITAVGPRNFLKLHPQLSSTSAPVICCENDANLPALMRTRTGKENIVFAIPDVISSSTAHESLKQQDPLAIITESGECFIEDTMKHLQADCHYVSHEEMHRQWMAKLFIHNTPHCIAAYLGNIAGANYLHEAMEVEGIAAIVEGAMNEMAKMLLAAADIDRDFIRYYSQKELSRFANKLLYDPIARVAREPFRKLAPNDRLLGAAQLCLSKGIVPENVLLGIMAAIYFDSAIDPDAHIAMLRRSLSPSEFMTTILGINAGEALFLQLQSNWDRFALTIESMKNAKRSVH